MSTLLKEFDRHVQAQQYASADSLVESLLQTDYIASLERKDALQLLYRIGYVYPELTLELSKQRDDIPRPFKDTLRIALGDIPPLRFYNQADTLVAIKIALMRHKPLWAKLLIYRFYHQYGLQPIDLVKNNKITIGNNRKKVKKIHNAQKVSIIVTTYNSAAFIENCIDSLLNQSIKNIEIIVVDDASNDNTVDILKKYLTIRVIKLSENNGTYHARNIGIEQSTGYFVTFQDSDDWSHPERLELQLKELLNTSTAIASFSHFFRVDQSSGLPTCRQNYPLLRLNLSSMMISRSILNKLGKFDSSKRIESDKKLFELIKSSYNDGSIVYIRKPLAIGLYRHDSLTTAQCSGFDKYGYSKMRYLT